MEIDLSYNQIRDKRAEAIAYYLISNATIESLYLNRNHISDKGMEAFAQALASNTVLETLYLINNQIGERGKKALYGLGLRYGCKIRR
ncbi:hypothetical protein [Candidatus Protochlamydia amoebophila]|uniref:Uncharacterized protein n=1 Tax=Protochlamydia amoebophila (strain UWE25) TaxID=264201 RepID=Q6MC30_PARUW|nr:hypothetical protein [Candidatus Protochlamydia amoebophila]CAF23869.1 unnamed protein product [Candidatus Protochlamydia amoebophila UWE25]